MLKRVSIRHGTNFGFMRLHSCSHEFGLPHTAQSLWSWHRLRYGNLHEPTQDSMKSIEENKTNARDAYVPKEGTTLVQVVYNYI